MTVSPVAITIPPEPPTLSNRQLRALLKRLGACGEARDAIGTHDGRTAWNACERGDQMLWLCARLVDRRLLARAAVACAQPAVTAYVPADEPRPQAALDAVLRWAADPTEANLERVREARLAAYAGGVGGGAAAYAAGAAAGAAADAAYAATDAAAYAAHAAHADAYAAAIYAAAAADADAAYAATDAAAIYAADAARREARAESLRRSAEIVREHIPFEVVLAAAGGAS